MAEVTVTGKPSLASVLLPPSSKISGLVAGEALLAGKACYIKTSDNKVYLASGAANNAAAIVAGFADVDAPVDEPVTLLRDCNIGYQTGLNGGKPLYLSGTVPGGLADAPSTGGLVPIGLTIDPKRIRIRANI